MFKRAVTNILAIGDAISPSFNLSVEQMRSGTAFPVELCFWLPDGWKFNISSPISALCSMTDFDRNILSASLKRCLSVADLGDQTILNCLSGEDWGIYSRLTAFLLLLCLQTI